MGDLFPDGDNFLLPKVLTVFRLIFPWSLSKVRTLIIAKTMLKHYVSLGMDSPGERIAEFSAPTLNSSGGGMVNWSMSFRKDAKFRKS
jgi:hypothetical protein